MNHATQPQQAPRSLQTRLLTTVLALVLAVWSLAAALAWRETRHEVNELLDAHLAQTAALLRLQPLDELDEKQLNEAPDLDRHQPHVVFQLWHEDQLLARSASAPQQPLAQRRKRGFADSEVEGKAWRVFVTPGRERDVRILVGERQSVRDEIVLASLTNILKPLMWALPLLALGIWWVVRGSVRPLGRLGQAVATRRPQSLAPLPTQGVPPEVLPLVTALNGLFERTAQLLATEQQFTADAAHELRTPIAAIRTQAQVALGARDDAERHHALAATLAGCDRAARLVDQLLMLARLEAAAAPPRTPLALAELARQAVADAAESPLNQGHTLALDAAGPAQALGDPLLTQVLLRNLLDNALRYSPPGSPVTLTLAAAGDGWRLAVEDGGPGLDDAGLARLGQRFQRGEGAAQPGSGLGWSIVRRVAALQGWTVAADRSPALGGLRVRLAPEKSGG